MPRKSKRVAQLLIETSPEKKADWKRKAAESGMTLQKWVEVSLDQAPVYEMVIAPKKAP